MLNLAVMEDWLTKERKLKRLKRTDEKYCVYYTEFCTCFIERNLLTDMIVLFKYFRDKLKGKV